MTAPDGGVAPDGRAARLGAAARRRAAPLAGPLRRALPVLRVIGFVASLAIVAVFGVVAVRDVDADDLELWLLAPGLLAALTWWVLLARGWAVLAAGRWTRADFATWCRTQALRYLPGGIWAPVSRVAVAGGTATDRVATVAAENLMALAAAMTLGGALLAAAGRPIWLLALPAAAIPLVMARAAPDRHRVDPSRALSATLGYLVAFAFYMGFAVLVQAAVSGFGDTLLVAGSAAVAWAVGLVVIIAPGGIGAREAAYVALLAPTFDRPELAAGAVTMRAVTIVAELIVLGFAGRPSG